MNRFSGFGGSLLPVALPLVLVLAGELRANPYDPLALNREVSPALLDWTVRVPARQRDIPLRIYLPTNTLPVPVVLFSHGLGGSRTSSAFLGRHWAARGYMAVFLQHPGSDEAVWKNEALGQRRQALTQAASPQNFLRRVQDISAVLDQLEHWNVDKAHSLANRLNLKKVGMSGHSFGAVTAQAVSGQSWPVGGQKFTDPRIQAAIAFSPSAPRAGSPERAFGEVIIPWLLMTGTRDLAPIGNINQKMRRAVYAALQRAPKYELVLHDAEHSVFTDRALPGDREPRNPNHHRMILAISTAFWDAYLRGDSAALAWLHGSGPRSVLEPADLWQFSNAKKGVVSHR